MKDLVYRLYIFLRVGTSNFQLPNLFILDLIIDYSCKFIVNLIGGIFIQERRENTWIISHCIRIFILLINIDFVATAYAISWENYSFDDSEHVPPGTEINGNWFIDGGVLHLGVSQESNFGFPLKGAAALSFDWKTNFPADNPGTFTFIDPSNHRLDSTSNSWTHVSRIYSGGDVKWTVKKYFDVSGEGDIDNLSIKYFNYSSQPSNASAPGTVLPGESKGLPIIKIRSPANGATTYINTTTDFLEGKFEETKVEFDYEPLDNEIIKNCELVIYKNLKVYNILKNTSIIENNVTNNFSFEFINPGDYSYKIICIDTSNRRNESRNQTIRIHPVMIVKSGDDIVESIERAKLENISVIRLIGDNYRFFQKKLPIDINQLNLIGNSGKNITISPYDSNTDTISIDSNNSLIQNITFTNLTLNISGRNILIIGNKFIGKHCGIFSISSSNISIKDNDFYVLNEKHNGTCLYVEKSNILNIHGNSFKGDIGLMINNCRNGSITNNDNQAREKCYYKNCINVTIPDGCICTGR